MSFCSLSEIADAVDELKSESRAEKLSTEIGKKFFVNRKMNFIVFLTFGKKLACSNFIQLTSLSKLILFCRFDIFPGRMITFSNEISLVF